MTKHVLIVEDDDDIRDLLIELLSASGHRVDSAANGAEALAALEHARPDVVILDLMMPVMDGWELRRRMLADPALRDIPVVITSGAAHLDETANLQAARVLKKPVPFERVLEAVLTFAA